MTNKKGQKTNNDLQYTTQKTIKILQHRFPLKTGDELRCSWRVNFPLKFAGNLL